MMESTRLHRPALGGCSVRGYATLALAVILLSSGGTVAGADTPPPGLLPLEDVSPVFLGMYRKVMEIEADIKRYAERYGVDFDLARAVCLYESGGNAGLNSGAGAQGYFQVMPATFRALRVESNIEAGVKYLSQMIRRFEREDRAIAAYNGGPGRVGRAGDLPLETLPAEPRNDLFHAVGNVAEYRMRHGDNYLKLAFTLGIEPDALRSANGLWHIQSVPVGVSLRIPLIADRSFLLHAALGLTPSNALERAAIARTALEPAPAPVVPADARRPSPPSLQLAHQVSRGDTLARLARRYGTTIRALQEANGLAGRTTIRLGQRLQVPGPARKQSPVRAFQEPRRIAHRVSRGETLAGLARRYGTTIPAIQQANDMARRTTIRTGERLQIPVPSTEEE